MRESVRRLAVAFVVISLVGILPVIALAANGPNAAAGKPTATRGPKKTPQPTVIVTAPPTAAPTNAPTTAPTTPPTLPPTQAPTLAPTVPPTLAPTLPPTAAPTAAGSVVLVGAGDIASCSSTGDEATAALLAGIAGTVFTLGDNVYDNGTTTEYANCYGPSWGVASIKSRTRPVAGNHEYNTPGATGYYGYFGAAAGDPLKGYYAYDAGAWRIYVLNSNCAAIAGGCGDGGAQETWLQNDLAANPRACVAAMWHHPRFSSGEHGSSTLMQAIWQTLYDANADLILVGHDHDYERFAPMTATGALDNARGIVEMVVGTGGRSHYATTNVQPNSLVRNSDTYGVLKLTLSATGWSFNFVPVAGKTFTDSGTGSCH